MTTNIPSVICLTPEQSQGNRIVTTQEGYPYVYKNTDTNGNHCYQLITGTSRRKRRRTPIPPCQPFMFTPDDIDLPDGQVGVPYSQFISVIGGTAPYTFIVEPLPSPQPPVGITLNAVTGELSGIPLVPSGPLGANFIVTVTDVNGCTGSHPYFIRVNPPS